MTTRGIVAGGGNSGFVTTTNLSASAGSSLVGFIQSGAGAVLRTAQSKLRDVVSVKDYGAVGDGSTDDTAAINLAIAGGLSLFWPAGTYKFTSALTTGTTSNVCWYGVGPYQSILLYTGASTTIDLVTCGDGTTAISNIFMKDIQIQSSTNMTAGSGLRVRKCTASIFDVVLQGQAGYATYGNYLYNGVYFDMADSITYNGQCVVAEADGIVVRGGLAGAGYKADLYINQTRIQNCSAGIRCAGAFGGLYINNVSAIQNVNHLVFDQTLTAESNRECFITQGIFDETTGGSGVYFNSADGMLFQATGSWFCSADQHGVHIANTSYAGLAIFSGCRFFNNTSDGIRVDSSACYVLIGVCGLHNNGAYGINPRVINHQVQYSGCYMFSNSTANVNGTYTPASSIGLNSIQQFENLSITDVSNDGTQLQITNTGSNGAGIKLTGDGATTPNKSMRVQTGVLQWLNSAFSAVVATLSDTGKLSAADKIYPGTDAAALQATCGLYAGTGAPNNANGANGDIYFDAAGGAMTTIYQRRAGTWVGIV